MSRHRGGRAHARGRRRGARRNPRPGRLLLGVTAGLMVAAGTGGTWAQWRDQAARPAAIITNGDLDLVDLADLTWVETTPGVSNPRSGSGLTGASGLSTFRATTGDTLEVRYGAQVRLRGDNISATLRASVVTPPPSGVVVTGFRILAADGSPLAPASGYQPVDSALVVPGLSAASTTDLRLAIGLRITAAQRYTAEVDGTTAPTLTPLSFAFDLTQVRSGTGFGA